MEIKEITGPEVEPEDWHGSVVYPGLEGQWLKYLVK